MANLPEYETCERIRPVVKNIAEVIESCSCQGRSQRNCFGAQTGGQEQGLFQRGLLSIDQQQFQGAIPTIGCGVKKSCTMASIPGSAGTTSIVC